MFFDKVVDSHSLFLLGNFPHSHGKPESSAKSTAPCAMHLSTPRQQPLVAPCVAVAFDGGGLRGAAPKASRGSRWRQQGRPPPKNWPGPAQFGGENSHKHVEFTWIGRCTKGFKIVVMMMMMMMIGNHIWLLYSIWIKTIMHYLGAEERPLLFRCEQKGTRVLAP